jgi:hypothetical protein
LLETITPLLVRKQSLERTRTNISVFELWTRRNRLVNRNKCLNQTHWPRGEKANLSFCGDCQLKKVARGKVYRDKVRKWSGAFPLADKHTGTFLIPVTQRSIGYLCLRPFKE